MTGILSWTEEVTALGVVVRIEHDLTYRKIKNPILIARCVGERRFAC